MTTELTEKEHAKLRLDKVLSLYNGRDNDKADYLMADCIMLWGEQYTRARVSAAQIVVAAREKMDLQTLYKARGV